MFIQGPLNDAPFVMRHLLGQRAGRGVAHRRKTVPQAQNKALGHIAQLANISRPRMGQQLGFQRGTKLGYLFAEFAPCLAGQVIKQGRYVCVPLG